MKFKCFKKKDETHLYSWVKLWNNVLRASMNATESVAAEATCDGEASCNKEAEKTKMTIPAVKQLYSNKPTSHYSNFLLFFNLTQISLINEIKIKTEQKWYTDTG